MRCLSVQWDVYQYNELFISTMRCLSVQWDVYQYNEMFISTMSCLSVQWAVNQYNELFISTMSCLSVQSAVYQCNELFISVQSILPVKPVFKEIQIRKCPLIEEFSCVNDPAMKGHLSYRDTFSWILRCLLKTGFTGVSCWTRSIVHFYHSLKNKCLVNRHYWKYVERFKS